MFSGRFLPWLRSWLAAMADRRFFLRGLLGIIVLVSFVCPAAAGERLYWDFPEIIRQADGGRFPQMISTGKGMAVVWQEFKGNPGSLNSTISIRGLISKDGKTWEKKAFTIAEELPYLWDRKVPLFSAAADKNGEIVVAVSEALKGVGIYSADSSGKYRRVKLLKSGKTAADTTVAPRLARAYNGELLLFLTRRAVVRSEGTSSILTIFLSKSKDGIEWSSPELFINPEKDTGSSDKYGNQALLEQNFLPCHLAYNGRDYVAFQTLRQGRFGRSYQIYL